MDEKLKESANQIYALVGQALFSAQSMEKELAFLIMIPEIMKNNKIPDATRVEQEIKKIDNCTFGQLMKKLKNHVIGMDEAAEKILHKALDKRNFLAHNYSHAHQGWLGNISEHDNMRKELIEMRELFRQMYDKFYQESLRNLKNIGLIPK